MKPRKKSFYALGRLKTGELNKTEQAYRELLSHRVSTGEVLWWKFEPMTLKLADNCRYCPDFFVMTADGELQAHEVKGSLHFIQDDAKVKIKVAASLFPFRFFLCAPKAKKDGGGWKIVEVGRGNGQDKSETL